MTLEEIRARGLDALRRELRPWGIEVCLLEPGAIATDIWGKGMNEFGEVMRNPPPSRRALFDIGAAGPWGGFLVAVPAVTPRDRATSRIDTHDPGFNASRASAWSLVIKPELMSVER